ncbi:MAG: hypothetical protein MJD61_09275 [Proteobacteria bacterium]|nr:hypothetical protein [Pseudomonadota bacterium]
MTPENAKLLLVVVGGLLVLFTLLRMLRLADSEADDIRRRIAEQRRRARDDNLDRAERRKAWMEAARLALEELHSPKLAAAYALRAERVEPGDLNALTFLWRMLRSASRYRMLETLLWRRLALDEPDSGPGYERTFDELLKLYEGPMRRPERAEVLRRLRSRRA